MKREMSRTRTPGLLLAMVLGAAAGCGPGDAIPEPSQEGKSDQASDAPRATFARSENLKWIVQSWFDWGTVHQNIAFLKAPAGALL